MLGAPLRGLPDLRWPETASRGPSRGRPQRHLAGGLVPFVAPPYPTPPLRCGTLVRDLYRSARQPVRGWGRQAFTARRCDPTVDCRRCGRTFLR